VEVDGLHGHAGSLGDLLERRRPVAARHKQLGRHGGVLVGLHDPDGIEIRLYAD
jgi:hypothetical protein